MRERGDKLVVLTATPPRRHRTRERQDRATTVTVVIPTLNEAKNLPFVLPRLPACVSELIVVDGDSSDGTVETALALCPEARIISLGPTGKGDALCAGFEASTGDIIVMLDADGSTDVAEIPAFIAALETGLDYVKGSRYLPGGGSSDLSLFRSLGNRMLTRIVNRLFATRYTDLCYGYAAFRRSALRQLNADCSGFEIETLLSIRAAAAGLRTAEVASFEHARIHGDSNLRPLRDGLRILRTILRERSQARASRRSQARASRRARVALTTPADTSAS